ncbi:MAG: YdeI/OmpD-associated family protein, partial [Clostridia bacterium]|nr:YdeI/OmpD-associated family protein [Clostridia bacterium]
NDIFDAIKADVVARENYEKLSEPYKRIRIAYIDAARKRPDEFKKRLASFINKTREGKTIVGYGGIDKYYKQKIQ